MAHLGTKTSDGQLSFDKYVKNNPKWSSGMKFVVEYGINQSPIVNIETNKPIETGNVVSGGQPLHIMSKSFKRIGRNRYAKIKLSGNSGIQGYLNVGYIRKPSSADVVSVLSAHSVNAKLDWDLEQTIKNVEFPITIVVNRTSGGGQMVAKEITNVKKIGGALKADLALVDKYGVPQMWISHKKEGDPSAFQQYFDISAQAGTKIYQHPECREFMNQVMYTMEGYTDENGVLDLSSTKLPSPLWSRINNKNLKRMALFGLDVAISAKFGVNNINLVGQGHPTLTPEDGNDDGVFNLSFSSHMITNEDVPECHGGGSFDCIYEPVFVAMPHFSGKFTLGGKSYRGAKLGIAPIAMVKNRQDMNEVT
tara:strand:- start:392 stop:1486 length:1095 start_codon:yes stop_codon:yes gene_type:complete